MYYTKYVSRSGHVCVTHTQDYKCQSENLKTTTRELIPANMHIRVIIQRGHVSYRPRIPVEFRVGDRYAG